MSELTAAWEGLPTLPLAEDVDPDLLFANDELLEKSPRRHAMVPRYYRGWNTLEIGLATRSVGPIDQAFETFHELNELPEADLRLKHFIGVRAILAYERLFRQRLQHEPISRKGINIAYTAIGAVLEELIEMNVANDIEGKISGSFSELLVDGALLRAKDSALLPYLGSKREEECLDGTSSSHDRYLLKAGPSPVKYPISIRRNQVLHKSDEYERGETLHPAVTTIPVVQIVSGVLRAVPELDQKSAQRSNSMQDTKTARLSYVAKLLITESRGGGLTNSQSHVLKEITSAFRRRCLAYAKSIANDRQAQAPLAQSLADQLRKKGFAE